MCHNTQFNGSQGKIAETIDDYVSFWRTSDCAKDDKHTAFAFPVIEDKACVEENQIKSVVTIPTMDNRQQYIFQHGLSVTE